MSNSEPMSLKEAEALADSLGVPVTRYISDKFDIFNDAQNLIRYKTTKNMREPLAIDITSLVIEEFSYKSAMPDIFDLDLRKEQTDEQHSSKSALQSN